MSSKSQFSAKLDRQTILDLTHREARDFFLKPESYCSLDLPPYIAFDELIKGVHQILDGRKLADFKRSDPRFHDDVNYTILHNKDGKFAWRPFQLIHPALYVSLVHAITEERNWTLIRDRFRQFAADDHIRCLSLPGVYSPNEKDRAGQISNWWHEVEQGSISMSLDYDYLIETDITDCYGAIYTHSISWALHTKDESKKIENRSNQKMIGVVIDEHIRDMRHGQTNGIPQGSALMDFIAEMVLGFADLELSKRLEIGGISDFHVIRYRDDYRIFVNSPKNGEAIVKSISEIMTGVGMKLNPAKTKMSNDVVRASIKSDKLAWISRKQSSKSLQKQLLIILDHSMNYPNAGSLTGALNDYHKRVSKSINQSENLLPLIAILVDIAYRNPRTYAICAAILSKLLSLIKSEGNKLGITNRIQKKFSQIPNTGHLQIWLQRITFPLDKGIDYQETICKLVGGSNVQLWNNEWISSRELKKAVNASKILNVRTRDEMSPIIPPKEMELFRDRGGEGYSL